MAAPATKQPNIYDLLEKLEALKAKQNTLESEVRETRALLNEKFRTLQERVGKVGAGDPTPVLAGMPSGGAETVQLFASILAPQRTRVSDGDVALVQQLAHALD